MSKQLKRFHVIEYCTGDFGDIGNHIGEIEAVSKETAKAMYQLENNIKDSEIDFYVFSEIPLLRPKSLQGIENNNGWIKIEEGLPKEQGKYLTYRKNGIMTEEHFYLATPYAWEKFYGVTHWKPIDKQKPPIH